MLMRMINGIKVRFNQETINIIKCIAHLIKLETDNYDVTKLSKIFGFNLNELEAKLICLK